MNKLENFSKFALSNEEVKNVQGGIYFTFSALCGVYYGLAYQSQIDGDPEASTAAFDTYVNMGCNTI